MKKFYVLDTNILMEDPRVIFGFDDNFVVVTGVTLQELDKHKNDSGETGFNTRESIRQINSLREKGDLSHGVEINNGGRFIIEANGVTDNLPSGFDPEVNDNKILSSILTLKEKISDPVILVTNDISMSVSASVLGIEVQTYKNARIDKDFDYKGYIEIEIPKASIDKIYNERGNERTFKTPHDCLKTYGYSKRIVINNNCYVNIKASDGGKQSAIGRIIKSDAGWYIKIIKADENTMKSFAVKANKVASKYAFDALTASSDDIPLVFLVGSAGTGKTYLSLACGLGGVDNGHYRRVMITRNNILSDADLGFLPGDLEDKMAPLIAPFTDNLKEILANKCDAKNEFNEPNTAMEELFDEGIVEICSMAYMRGRSLNDTYLIVDEAQNATYGQLMEIITRAGKGTKIIICGDPDQIDNPKLDKYNNGLTVVSKKMIEKSRYTALIKFNNEDSVRSILAKEASEILKTK